MTKIGRCKAYSQKYKLYRTVEKGYQLFLRAHVGLATIFDPMYMEVSNGMIIDNDTVSFDIHGDPVYLEVDVTENMSYIPAGFGIGIKNMSFGGFGTQFTGEIGMLPGPKGQFVNLFYVDMKMGIRIGRLFKSSVDSESKALISN